MPHNSKIQREEVDQPNQEVYLFEEKRERIEKLTQVLRLELKMR
jgi:hypothetical protein